MKELMSIFAVALMLASNPAAAPGTKNCTCEECVCTPENNCGCLPKADHSHNNK